MITHFPKFKANSLFQRQYAVTTPKSVFDQLDLSSQKITQLAVPSMETVVPLESDWETPSKIKVHRNCSGFEFPSNQAPVRYYFGGLIALMQAARELKENGCKEQVVYVNDGKISKTLQSGNQGHVHPSEWSAPECQTLALIKTLLQGLHIIKEDDPDNLAHYSYLHFPVNVKKSLKDFPVYFGFFARRLLLDLTTKQGLSKNDEWLCENIKDSLSYHKKLSDEIEKETGFPTFKQGFRVYWSINKEALQKKKEIWDRLGIPCEYMEEEEIFRHTLLKVHEKGSVLKILQDGKFLPDCSSQIIKHLERNFPNQFIYRKAEVEKIYLEDDLVAVQEKDGNLTSASSLFGSPGHSEVLEFDHLRNKWKPLWKEVPVSAISSLWKCTIDKQELKSRIGDPNMDDVALRLHAENLVAQANLSNLHVTSWNAFVNNKNVEMIVRATQGANFNSYVASKNDLYNMRNHLNLNFTGDWELLSAGTCTRKTWISNVPEYHELSPSSGLVHGQSGIGYSFSAVDIKNIKHP